MSRLCGGTVGNGRSMRWLVHRFTETRDVMEGNNGVVGLL